MAAGLGGIMGSVVGNHKENRKEGGSGEGRELKKIGIQGTKILKRRYYPTH